MEIVISTFTNLTCMVHIHAYPELIDERFDVYYKKTLIMIAASKKRLGELIKNTAGIVIIRNIIGTSDEDINSVYRWMDENFIGKYILYGCIWIENEDDLFLFKLRFS